MIEIRTVILNVNDSNNEIDNDNDSGNGNDSNNGNKENENGYETIMITKMKAIMTTITTTEN